MPGVRDLVDELLAAKVKTALFGGDAADRAPRLGRLVVQGRLGHGAMGQVVAAYDPRLDRKVAVKLVRATGPAARARVLAEARALARISHPSVVPIHDVDELPATGAAGAGVIFVVMELLAGPTLRTWAGAEPEAARPWPEVVRVIRQLAGGLAAVHAAGLLHRDVKPDNVIVGPDRARLIDFGLASAASGGDDGAGTPAYLAPEVLRGGPASPASDQFALAVTAWEVLHGARPHVATGDRAATAEAAAAADRARPRRRVPAFVQRALVRALAAEPGARFPTVTDLAAALDPTPRRRRRVAALVAVAAIGAAGATWAVAAGGATPAPSPCAHADAALARTFPPALAEATTRALGAEADRAGLPAAAEAWTRSYRAVCEATHVRGDQSAALLDLRMRCLDRQLARRAALAHALTSGPDERGDDAARRGAAVAFAELPAPAACVDVTSPAELATPTDPAIADAVARSLPRLDAAWAAYVLGRYPDARAALTALSTGPDAGAAERHPAYAAQRLLLAASLEARTGAPAAARALLDQLLQAAAAAEAPSIEAEAWVRLLRGELFTGDPARVVEWAPFARAAATRAHLRGAAIDSLVGQAAHARGDLDGARRNLEQALTGADELRADQRAIVEMRLAWVWMSAGRTDRARPGLVAALATARATLGDDHPELALYRDKLAAVARADGDLAGALAEHDAALAVRTRDFGGDDRAVATTLLGRARTLLEAGQLATAAAALDRAEAIRVGAFGAGHRRLGEVALVRAELAAAAGRVDDARVSLRRARALDADASAPWLAARLGEPAPAAPPGLGAALISTDALAAAAAEVVAAAGRGAREQARAQAEAVRAAWQRAGGEALVAEVSNQVGAALHAAGDRDGAAAVFAAARARAGAAPSRQALLATRGLAATATGAAARAAATEAAALAAALPELVAP